MSTHDVFFYENIVRLVVTELRGRETQKVMSERLGCRYNQWHKWESGQKNLMWNDLRKIASLLNLKLDEPMQRISDSDVSIGQSGGLFIKKIIQKYGGFNSVEALKKLGVSKATLNRLMSSKKDVEVAFVFKCLGELSSTLPFFISYFVKDFKNSSIREAVYKMNRQVHLEGDFPWLSTIEAYIETSDYKTRKFHSDKELAGELGLSISDIKSGLKLLLENQTIVQVGDKYKLNLKRVDMETNIEDSARFAAFWTRVCAERYNTIDGVPQSRRGWSSRVFPVSNEGFEEIERARTEFINKMSKILSEDRSRKKDKVQIFILHLFDQHEFKNLFITKKNTQN
ncbi:MAG: hypothetical protein B7Y39_17235 [Bdellovibrio sp. 28-41-41]|nr:MAG: hypothetical protein B7Y39_17235 [Bdellovibrio sp. 28-41-41]